MKSKFLIFAVIVSTVIFSCSTENELDSTENANFTFTPTGTDVTSYYYCLSANECNPLVNIETSGPLGLNAITVHYASWMGPNDIDCLRRAYFSCDGLLRMSVLQPNDSHIDTWLVPHGKPSQTTTETINEDPRVTTGGNTGG